MDFSAATDRTSCFHQLVLPPRMSQGLATSPMLFDFTTAALQLQHSRGSDASKVKKVHWEQIVSKASYTVSIENRQAGRWTSCQMMCWRRTFWLRL